LNAALAAEGNRAAPRLFAAASQIKARKMEDTEKIPEHSEEPEHSWNRLRGILKCGCADFVSKFFEIRKGCSKSNSQIPKDNHQTFARNSHVMNIFKLTPLK
jgi:hypothetical protein